MDRFFAGDGSGDGSSYGAGVLAIILGAVSKIVDAVKGH